MMTLTKTVLYEQYTSSQIETADKSMIILSAESVEQHTSLCLKMLKEMTRLLQKSTYDESLNCYCYILYMLCYIQQWSKCDFFVTTLAMYLHEISLQCQAQKVLLELNMCAEYEQTRKILREMIEKSK